ncbi:MAG TPA: ribonuclease P protein component [Puia sp.]|nr:ribonuclease P protein component [Puia sp.]
MIGSHRSFTWNKKEKLKSRKRIERVFREGKSLSVFPFKIYWLLDSAAAGSPLQAGFGVSSRNFKNAVDRNRIKRLSRESYRLLKPPLLARLKEQGRCMAVFFVYTGKDLPEFATVSKQIGVALQRILKELP